MTSIDNLEDSSTETVSLLRFNNVTGPWAFFVLCSGRWGEAERRELLCRDKGPLLCCAISGKWYHPFVSRGKKKKRIMAISGASQVVLVLKNPPGNAGDAGNPGLIPGWGRCPGGGRGNPLQYSCLENPQGQRRLVGYSPWGCRESDTTEQLSMQHTSF